MMYDEWEGTSWAGTEVQARAIDSFVDHPGLTEQLMRVQGLTPRPWRPASLTEALGVPAIFGAVTLISKTIGSMAMRALRNEVELAPDDRPRVIVRPDPFRIPAEFYAGTGYNLASRGEAIWWTAKRDGDGNALSILNLPVEEITYTDNIQNPLRPTIEWRGIKLRNEDVRQIVFHRTSPFALRGLGPLQMCGAAISVAVESQEWAANFFADGSHAPLVIRSAVDLADDPNDPDGLSEAERLAAAWAEKGNNRPRVVDPDIADILQLDEPSQGAQMLDARQHEVGDVARMFSIPGALLEYAMGGSNLTYQTLATIYDDFLRRCLRPNYLTPIEQTMSDLIPRSTVAKFDTDALVLADIRTRADVYNILVPLGVMTVEQAQAKEGFAPGDTDNAAIPFSPPQAFPSRLPIQPVALSARSAEVRCSGTRLMRGLLRPCGKLLGELSGEYSVTCPRCGTVNQSAIA